MTLVAGLGGDAERYLAVMARAAELTGLDARHRDLVGSLLHVEELHVAVLAGYLLSVYLLLQVEGVGIGNRAFTADVRELKIRGSGKDYTRDCEGHNSRHRKYEQFFHFFTSFLFESFEGEIPLGIRRLEHEQG